MACLACLAIGAAPAADTPLSQRDDAVAAGGNLELRFNPELLAQLGLHVRGNAGVPGDATVALTLSTRTRVGVATRGASLDAWNGGEFDAAPGFALVDGRGVARIDLPAPRLRPRPGSTAFDIVDRDGRVALRADSVMAVLPPDRTALAIAAFDLRLGDGIPGFEPHAGLGIGDGQARIALTDAAPDVASSCAVPHWPGSDGGAYVADLLLDDISAQMMRCGEPGCSGAACTCDGPGGGDAAVVVAPRAELSNSSDDNGGLPCTAADPCAADIPWNPKFSAPAPPYGNDQHPLLVWNLYRLDADGGIAQIGRSGVKHAFVALNIGCDCADPHVLGRGCGDVYATNNNDNNNALAPRSEIVAASAQWGRCGSIEDDEVVAPNPDLGGCDGVRDASGNTAWSQRLAVRESQLDPAANPGARYVFEAWYLVRDDVAIDNSIGYIDVAPSWNGTWNLPRATGTTFRRGPALTAWADPAAPDPRQRVATYADARGELRLATRVRALGGGRWRYDYALMNLTFAQARTSGAEPNLRVLGNAGIAGVSVPLASDVAIDADAFDDGDVDAANDWTAQRDAQHWQWRAAGTRTQDWGTLFRYSLTADAAPIDAHVSTVLDAMDTPGPVFAALVPGPRAEHLFTDGFDTAPDVAIDTFFN